MPCIKESINAERKKPVIFPFHIRSPGAGMKFQPRQSFAVMLIEFLFRDRICKPPGNKVRSSTLLPMRQSISGVLDFCPRIEEYYFVRVHTGGLTLRRYAATALQAVKNRLSLSLTGDLTHDKLVFGDNKT